MNFDTKYLLDTVSISKLKSEHIESYFFQNNVKIPDEILYELRDSPHLSNLEGLRYEITSTILGVSASFLKTLPNTSNLIDLYNFEGNGDIILISIALHEIKTNNHMLLKTDWKIVTDDDGLKSAAQEVGIAILSTDKFTALRELAS